MKSFKIFTVLTFTFGLLLSTVGSAGPKITSWLFVHGPEDPEVLSLIDKYSKRITTKSGQEINVGIQHMPDTTFQTAAGWDSRWHQALSMVTNGSTDIVQIATRELASLDPIYEVYDLPFLFDNYAHLEGFFKGEGGKALLERVKTASNGKLRALGFTYSGGFRAIGTYGNGKGAEGYASCNFVRERPLFGEDSGFPDTVRTQSLRALGVKFEKMNLVPGELELFNAKKINAVQYPYKDLENFERHLNNIGKFSVIEDRMNVFSTTILVREEFFQSLSKKNQELLVKEITELADEERAVFIEDNKKSKEKLIARGHKVYTLSEVERMKLRGKVQPVYEKFLKHKGAKELLKAIDSHRVKGELVTKVEGH